MRPRPIGKPHDARASERRFHRRAALLAISSGTLLLLGHGLAGEAVPEFRVVGHPALPVATVSRKFLADAFLKNITRWPNDDAIRPVDQLPSSEARHRFSDDVLKRSVSAVKIYWQQRIFAGRGVPPPELESDAAVVRYVESNPGAVGYISGRASQGKTKVLTLTP